MKKLFIICFIYCFSTCIAEAQTFCESGGAQPWQQWISQVEVAGIIHTSGKDRYEFFENEGIIFEQSENYSINITASFSWQKFDEYFSVWIDFNGNGSFEDSGELVLQEAVVADVPYGPSSSMSGFFSMPSGFSIGHKRMRVAMKKDAFPESCEQFEYGEVQDYLVEVKAQNNDVVDVAVDITTPTEAALNEVIDIYCGVRNFGGGVAENVVVKINCYEPFNNLKLVSWDLIGNDAGTYNPDNFEWSLPPLDNDNQRFIKLTVKIQEAGQIPIFMQVINQDQEDIDSSPNNALIFEATEDDEKFIEIDAQDAGICFQHFTFHSQSEIDVFQPCNIINGDVIISGLNISNLSAFEGIQRIEGNLTIENTSIDRLSGFDDLEMVEGELKIKNNLDLTTFSGLGNLTRTKSLHLENLPFVQNLDGMESLNAAYENLVVVNLPLIKNLKRTNGLVDYIYTDKMRFENNALLEDITAIRTSDDVYGLELIDNPNLQKVNIFAGFDNVFGNFILRNSGLEDCFEIRGLEGAHLIEISNNSYLRNLDDLQNLIRGTDLILSNNPVLEDCCGIVPLIESGRLNGNFTIENNPNACSNKSEIIATCNGGNYCTSAASAPWQEWIANVAINDLNNASGKCHTGSCGYSDFTDLSTTLAKGETYDLSVTPGFSYFHKNQSTRVWIDFNQDKDFNDPGETVYSMVIPAGVHGQAANTGTAAIVIPEEAISGVTRMRISMKPGFFSNACSDITRGEVEDYTIIIGNDNTICDIYDIDLTQWCVDNGTPNDPSDDLLTSAVYPVAENWSRSFYLTGDIDSEMESTNQIYIDFNKPFPVDGNFDFTIYDEQDPNCFLDVNIMNPETCSFGDQNLPDLVPDIDIVILNYPSMGLFGRVGRTNQSVYGPATAKLYLSTDEVLSADDIFVGKEEHLAAMANYPGVVIDINGTISNNLAPGDYFGLMVVDANNVIAESDESNNVQAYPVTYAPIDGLDLSLGISAAPMTIPKKYETYTLRYTLENIGQEVGRNIEIELPLPDGLVYVGGDEYIATKGTYNVYRNKWSVESLEADQRAYLYLNYFLRSDQPITHYAQIIEHDGDDLDSSPGNGVCCIENEDDESVYQFSQPILRREKAGLEELLVYPNPARDEIKIDFSTLPTATEMHIYNALGIKMKTVDFDNEYNPSVITLDVSKFENGLYVILINGKDFKPRSKMFAVKNTR